MLNLSAIRGDQASVEEDFQGTSGSSHDPYVLRQELRPRATHGSHVIVFANEKGGVGKSTAAFHTCVALCSAAETVVAIDLDRRQQSLGTALRNREGTSRRLKIDFPRPRHVVLEHLTEAGLNQEINRLGRDCGFTIIDVAGNDSPIARHAIAMADTLVTPVNDSFVDIDVLGHLDPINFRFKSLGKFAQLVQELREVRTTRGEGPADWVVVQNRLRRLGSTNEQRFTNALHELAPEAGFRLAPGLGERVIFRELFPFGLTLFDLKLIPEFARAQPVARAELMATLAALKLPTRVAF